MKGMFRLVLVAGLVAALAACSAPASPTPNPDPTDLPPTPAVTLTPQDGGMLNVMDYRTLVGLLRSAGHTVEEGETLEPDIFSVTGRVIKLNGADVQVYEYATPAEMEEEASRIGGAGSMFTTKDGAVMQIDWMDPPHFFKSGRVLVNYVGRDEAIVDALEAALGPEFTGGEGGGFLPPAGVERFPGADDLVQKLQAAGAEIQFGDEPLAAGLFSMDAQILKVNGQDLQVYSFADEAAADAAAATVSPDGGTIGAVSVRWIAPPRFYRTGVLIVLYVGDDAEIAALLDSALGQPFAGG